MKRTWFKKVVIRVSCAALACIVFASGNASSSVHAAGNVVDSITADKAQPKIGDKIKVSIRIGSGYGNISRISEIYANYIPANRPKESYPLGLYYNASNGLYEGYITSEETYKYGPGNWLVGSLVIFDKQYKKVAVYNLNQTTTGTKQNLNGGNFKVVSAVGWYSLKGNWYYVDPATGSLKKGWLSENGFWYFLDQNGMMKKGWLLDNGTWYFLNNSGAMVKEWLYKNGQYFYLDPNSGAMKKGWQKINNVWYYLNSPNGDMKIGWLKDNNNWYFLDNGGGMKTGWYQYGKTWYYFYNDGVMAHDTNVNGYWLGSNGAWVQ